MDRRTLNRHKQNNLKTKKSHCQKKKKNFFFASSWYYAKTKQAERADTQPTVVFGEHCKKDKFDVWLCGKKCNISLDIIRCSHKHKFVVREQQKHTRESRLVERLLPISKFETSMLSIPATKPNVKQKKKKRD